MQEFHIFQTLFSNNFFFFFLCANLSFYDFPFVSVFFCCQFLFLWLLFWCYKLFSVYKNEFAYDAFVTHLFQLPKIEWSQKKTKQFSLIEQTLANSFLCELDFFFFRFSRSIMIYLLFTSSDECLLAVMSIQFLCWDFFFLIFFNILTYDFIVFVNKFWYEFFVSFCFFNFFSCTSFQTIKIIIYH